MEFHGIFTKIIMFFQLVIIIIKIPNYMELLKTFGKNVRNTCCLDAR